MAKFGTSGMRGKFGEEITAGLAIRLGQAVVTRKGMRVAVGRDSRATGPLLEQALISGILSAGGIALRAGIVPTPTLALAVRNHADFGVMITASHNPPEYNGFKLLGKEGEAGKEVEERIEKAVGKEMKVADWQNIGESVRLDGVVREHMDLVLKLVDVPLIRRKAPKVVVDCGNGAACSIMPALLKEAGCKVVAVNAEPSGQFARGLEPNEENLAEAAKLVKAVGADLGIAHDGDADRAIAIDERGELLGLDAQLALICGEELAKRKGTVVSTIEASLAVKEAVESNGGKLVVTKVGSLHVAREMRKLGAVFGGEPCGEYIFTGGVPMPDGMLAGLRLVELFCRKGKLSALKAKVKTYPIKRARFESKDKEAAMRKIAPEVRKAFKGKFFEEDGVRVDFEGGWVLVRASGTEPIVRITAEAKDERLLGGAYSKAEAIVKKYA